MNKFTIVGNIVRDPSQGETPSGIAFCKFTVAVNRPYSNKNEERQADYFDITTWRAQSEVCAKYLKKGSKVAVIARVQNRTYEDSNGTKHYVNDFIAEEVEFLSSAASSQGNDEKPAQAEKKPSKPQTEEVQEELPF